MPRGTRPPWDELPSLGFFRARRLKQLGFVARLWVSTTLAVLMAALFAACGYWVGSGVGADATRAGWHLAEWFLGALGCLLAAVTPWVRSRLAVPLLAVSVASVLWAVWLTGVLGAFGITDPAHEVSMVVEPDGEDRDPSKEGICPPSDRTWDKRPRTEPGAFTLGGEHAYEVDSSAASICLDAQEELASDRGWIASLQASYADYARDAGTKGPPLLASIELIQGKAKQLDDGLAAAVVTLLTLRSDLPITSLEDWLRTAIVHLQPDGPGAAWAWAALAAGGRLSPSELERLSPVSRTMLDDASREAPTGFYEWSEELSCVWRMVHHLQRPWRRTDAVPQEVGNVIGEHPDLAAAYSRILQVLSRLANPADNLTFLGSLDEHGPTRAGGRTSDETRFLPLARTHEVDALRSGPIRGGTMDTFIDAIRSGRIELAPKPDSGFYDHLTFASETLLLPERGPEFGKLLVAPGYRRRLRHAFASLQAKHRDTLGLLVASGKVGMPLPPVAPRFRVEPAPTHYLRMAAAYHELSLRLDQLLSHEVLTQAHGRQPSGLRSQSLAAELDWIETLYLGLHLVSCEDLGLDPWPDAADQALEAKAQALALEWLATWRDDPDLSVDTRVAVKIADEDEGRVRVWATLGVRGTIFRAWYQGPVRVRPVSPTPEAVSAKWSTACEPVPVEHLIMTDDFAELSLTRVPTRAELRRIGRTAHERKEFVQELSRSGP